MTRVSSEIQTQTVKKAISENVTEDPRIDSPDIQVIYPADEPFTQTRQSDPVTEQPTTPEPDQPKEEKKEDDHTCEVNLQEAIKQNLIPFIILIVLAFGFGYLIGKK